MLPSESSAITAWANYWSDLARKLEQVAIAPALLHTLLTQATPWYQVAVRSSMAIEDGASAAAPGLFVSLVEVPATAPALADALRAVWTSACTPMVGQYRAGQAASIGGFAVAVIVQQFVAGERLVIYTRPPGAATEPTALLQRSGTTRRLARNDTTEPALRLALAAENAIGADRGADVELVQQPDGTLWVVQARPIVHPRANAARLAPPPTIIAAMRDDERTWSLDYSHNPTPLSTAQAELVQAVQAAGIAPFALRLCAGYLYSTPLPAPTPALVSWPDGVLENAQALAAYWATLSARVEVVLAGEASSLAAVVQRYIAFYDLWANHVAPLIKAARKQLKIAFAAQNTPLDQQRELLHDVMRPSSIDRQLQRCANGEIDESELKASIADVATQWDVAAPTYGEHWQTITQAIGRLRNQLLARQPSGSATTSSSFTAAASNSLAARLHAVLPVAKLAADYAEQDDLWFFRAQAQIRRALLQRAGQLDLAEDHVDDIFWLPWSMLQDAAHFEPMQAHALARAARAAAQRASNWHMPLHLGGTPTSRAANATAPAPDVAVGGGGRFSGTVCRLRPDALTQLQPASIVDSRVVIVARALTPGVVVGLAGATGIVCDSGGFLDHGAAMARELGLPYLVGAHDVFDRCYDGQHITVDPDSGTVTLYP